VCDGVLVIQKHEQTYKNAVRRRHRRRPSAQRPSAAVVLYRASCPPSPPSHLPACPLPASTRQNIAAAVIVNAAARGAPCVVAVRSSIANARGVEAKLRAYLPPTIFTRYIGTRPEARRFLLDEALRQLFLEGRLVLLTAANATPLRYLAALMRLTGAEGGLLLVDEADALWSRKPDAAGRVEGFLQREEALYGPGLLGTPPLCRTPGPLCSPFRAVCFVTATALPILAWLHSWGLGFHGFSADLTKMGGYATYDDLKPMQARRARAAGSAGSARSMAQRMAVDGATPSNPSAPSNPRAPSNPSAPSNPQTRRRPTRSARWSTSSWTLRCSRRSSASASTAAG